MCACIKLYCPSLYRVLVSAVFKKTTNLKLHFFSNHPEIKRDMANGLKAAKFNDESTNDIEIGKLLSAS